MLYQLGVWFHPAFLTDAAQKRGQPQTRRRVVKLFQRRERLSPKAAEMLRGWEPGGGVSLNAEVRVPSWDRAGLERRVHDGARPIFASTRLAWIEPDQRVSMPCCPCTAPTVGAKCA